MFSLKRADVLSWLRESNPSRLAELYRLADETRRERVGDEVHLRGLIEISSHCARSCHYCGLRAGNAALKRYRMTADEVMSCVRDAVAFGYGTVVMQSGEDPGIKTGWVSDVVRRIKTETALAVTLSLGERSDAEFAAWREAGADRYLLRFETSDRKLYDAIHPPLGGVPSDRIAILRRLRALGYEIGSGIMVGIPGQTYESLADDLELMRTLDLDMIGLGPYIPHPATPLGAGLSGTPAGAEQVPNTDEMTTRALALARLLCPEANIPSTTALATINLAQGRELGLMRGANVVMPNLTPTRYRALYEIYPGKACVSETAENCNVCLRGRIMSIGRTVGVGPGTSPRYLRLAGQGVQS